MSDFSLTLVLRLKTSKIINGMAKVQIKSEKITPILQTCNFPYRFGTQVSHLRVAASETLAYQW